MENFAIKKTRYSRTGKIQTPLPDDKAFIKGMKEGKFCQERQKGIPVLQYYTAIRISEALRCIPEQFQIQQTQLYFDVGKRLKHGTHTPALVIPRDADYVEELIKIIRSTKSGQRIFPYCRKTGYNVIVRAFGFYPHFFRLNRITNFFLEGWSIAEVRTWTGLTLTALDYYVGLVNIQKMGMSLAKKKK